MRVEKITRRTKEYNQIKALKDRNFPPQDQFPMWLIVLLAKRKTVDFYAFYDGELFCGFAYVIRSKGMFYFRYLAVEETLRSKGYGGQILSELRKLAGGMPMTFNIEPLDPSADNYEQRVRRKAFYLRNGFLDTGYDLNHMGHDYYIMTDREPCDLEEYKRLLKGFAFGFYNAKVKKRETH
ncbi:MAG: GNAT family N-acetyltransferase [Clostridiales bacterium]|nr:GNAT family N-acetyltransferase [Clostridiales bacterium]